jgi:hypothetical protein
MFLFGHLIYTTGFMFLISWRGYWQELIERLLGLTNEPVGATGSLESKPVALPSSKPIGRIGTLLCRVYFHLCRLLDRIDLRKIRVIQPSSTIDRLASIRLRRIDAMFSSASLISEAETVV